ncbi:MAG: efflux RND transporter periplasmic adaptor subunit [Thiogranum sp.]|nr:efflux RND transporter periplasmic adaptor subunit [Thiogranum sp.]
MAFRHFRRFLYLLIVILLIGAVVFWLRRPEPVPVVVHEAVTGVVRDTTANTRAGTIEACNRARISPSIGGQIASLPVSVGDAVEAGQLLMELWNEDRLAEVTLAASEAGAAKARASEACVRAEVAEREAKRLATLRARGLATEEAADRADGEARALAAGCTAARASADVSQSRLDVARALLSRTRLTAPFDGIVAEINGEVGEFVTPSPIGVPTPPAVDLVDITCLYASAPIDEVDAPALRVGMPAVISLDAFSERNFAGEVRRIAPYILDVEKQARTVDVEVDFIDPADTARMLPGYTADIEIILEERTDTLRIPTEAVLEGNRVLVFSADGILQERDIRTGLSNWKVTEVLEGLSAGDLVVVSVDRDGVRDGAPAVIESIRSDDD